MDMNEYLIEHMVSGRLSDLHAAAEQQRLARIGAPSGSYVRVALGLALIRLGTWALGPTHRPLASRTS
jgi:hypothetical protein